MQNEFTAVYERDGEWFIGYCLEVPGANGQGRSMEEGRDSLRDAVQLILEDRRDTLIPNDVRRSLKKTKLSDQGQEEDLQGTTPEQRIEMMWQLALDAWAFMGEPVIEPRLPRHVARVVRGKC